MNEFKYLIEKLSPLFLFNPFIPSDFSTESTTDLMLVTSDLMLSETVLLLVARFCHWFLS